MNLFLKKYSKYKDLNFLINDSTNCFEHMQKISFKSNADYIMFLHDDDLFGKELLVKNFDPLQSKNLLQFLQDQHLLTLNLRNILDFNINMKKKLKGIYMFHWQNIFYHLFSQFFSLQQFLVIRSLKSIS